METKLTFTWLYSLSPYFSFWFILLLVSFKCLNTVLTLPFMDHLLLKLCIFTLVTSLLSYHVYSIHFKCLGVFHALSHDIHIWLVLFSNGKKWCNVKSHSKEMITSLMSSLMACTCLNGPDCICHLSFVVSVVVSPQPISQRSCASPWPQTFDMVCVHWASHWLNGEGQE